VGSMDHVVHFGESGERRHAIFHAPVGPVRFP
jgi:hypothetical protein